MADDRQQSWLNGLQRKPRVMRDMLPKVPKLRESLPVEAETQLAPAPAGPQKSRETALKKFFKREESKPAERSQARSGADIPLAKLEIKRWRPGARHRKMLWLCGGGAAGGIAAMLILLSTVFARAYITVEPLIQAKTLASTAVTVTPDAHAIDPARKIIPGELIELTETREIQRPATGRRTVSEYARGMVTIYNAYSSQPQVLVANTRFSSSDGKIFKLAKSTTVPGAKVQNGAIVPNSIEAEIIAAEPGEAYNLSPAEFRIPGFQGSPRYQGFSARSGAAFDGGFEGEASVVTKTDLDRASEDATREVYQQLKDLLKKRVPEGFTVIDGGHEIDITSVVGPEVNSRATQFVMKATGRVRGIAFRDEDEKDFIAALFSASMSYALVEGGEIRRDAISLDLAKRRLSFVLSGKVNLESKIDKEALLQDALGKSENELKETLSQSGGVQAYRIKFFPFWIKEAPRDPAGIRVEIGKF